MRRWVAIGVLVALVAGCGDDAGSATSDTSGLAVPWVDPDGDPPIVGSLTVNPADSTLFMGTNTGLFRIPEGATEPEKIVGELETPDGSGKVSESLVGRFTGADAQLGAGPGGAGPHPCGLRGSAGQRAPRWAGAGARRS